MVTSLVVVTLTTSSFSRADTSADLQAYLDQKPACEIVSVEVGQTTIKISGKTSQPNEQLFLGHLPMEAATASTPDSNKLVAVASDKESNFSIEVPRIAKRGDRDRQLRQPARRGSTVRRHGSFR